jgi:hypothetical protein
MFLKRFIAAVTLVAVTATGICSCSSVKPTGTAQVSAASSEESTTAAGTTHIPHRYASAEEGRELMLANKEYYAGFSQNDLDYRMQKTGATMDEYIAFAEDQVLDFTEQETGIIDGYIANMEKCLEDNGYMLPPLDEIIFIKTTMEEEGGAGGYTNGTQIYLGDYVLDMFTDEEVLQEIPEFAYELLWHELFHCLTRCNPEFRKDMYSLIGFTVTGTDYKLPASVFEYHISNHDVEHHDSYATFIIDGKEIDCFTDFITTKHYDEAKSDFFSVSTTALVPIDGTDIYYTPEQASNFDDVFGTNTDYVVDPEECLADNFSLAVTYGMKGPNGTGYPNPEIIQGIIDYLKR